MQKYYTKYRIGNLSKKFDGRKTVSLSEYNHYIKKEINHIFSRIPKILESKIKKLHETLLEKYINDDKIESIERFWKDHQPNKAIVKW